MRGGVESALTVVGKRSGPKKNDNLTRTQVHGAHPFEIAILHLLTFSLIVTSRGRYRARGAAPRRRKRLQTRKQMETHMRYAV
jgi:hypothetical protein